MTEEMTFKVCTSPRDVQGDVVEDVKSHGSTSAPHPDGSKVKGQDLTSNTWARRFQRFVLWHQTVQGCGADKEPTGFQIVNWFWLD